VKKTCTDFDTFELMRTLSQKTATNLRAGQAAVPSRSILSGYSNVPRVNQDGEPKASDSLKQAEVVSKNEGNILSENLDTNSFISAEPMS